MARPPKAEHEQRRHKVKFLLTDAELKPAQDQARRSGLDSVHALARVVTVDGRIRVQRRAGLPFAAVHQSNRLGVVLKQVERHAQTHGEPVPPFGAVQTAIRTVFEYDYAHTMQSHGLEDDPRPHEVKFLLTEAERNQVRQAAEALKLRVNDYARLCTTGKRYYRLVAEQPFPAQALQDVRGHGRAIWQALGHSRATGAPLPSFANRVRILEGLYHTVYLPRLS